jgi:2TM domain-containing protein
MSTEQIPTENFAAEPNSRPAAGEVRARAVRQIERRRRFYRHAIAYAGASVLLIVIWAASEYHNAGGWPTDGFSQSSGISHVWNSWIIYPILGLGLLLGIDAWKTFGEKPISESDIRREIDRMK